MSDTRFPYTYACDAIREVVDDGLSKPWHGRVWCNPPFGREAVKWLRRMRDHGNGVALIPPRTDARAILFTAALAKETT